MLYRARQKRVQRHLGRSLPAVLGWEAEAFFSLFLFQDARGTVDRYVLFHHPHLSGGGRLTGTIRMVSGTEVDLLAAQAGLEVRPGEVWRQEGAPESLGHRDATRGSTPRLEVLLTIRDPSVLLYRAVWHLQTWRSS